MTQVERIIKRTIYKKSFYEFLKAFWHTADPEPYVDGKLIRIYCEFFQYLCRAWVGYEEVEVDTSKLSGVIIDIRGTKNKLCLNVPPRHTKSLTFNVMGPVWLWLHSPIKAASVSHTSRLSKQMNEKRKSVLNSPEFAEFFPEIEIITNTSESIIDSRRGELYSVNRDAFTGYGATFIINDDLTNAESAKKDQQEMANAISYYRTTMPSRVNNMSKCIIMNIQQRLAPNDVTGYIMSQKKLAQEYDFVVLPAIFEEETNIVLPITGEIITFKPGDTLFPERYSKDNYQSLRNSVGEANWETQYLQKPVATDRTVIKENMINLVQYSEVQHLLDTPDANYASHDFPVKDKEKSDFLGSIRAVRVGSNTYIMNCLEEKQAIKKSLKYVRGLHDFYPGIIQLIEDKANGSPILQLLQGELAGLQAFQPGSDSKIARAESTVPFLQNVYFVAQEWNPLTLEYELGEDLQMLVDRLLAFPFVTNDDIVDAFTQLIMFIYLEKQFSVYGKSFNNDNIIDDLSQFQGDLSTTYFNKEGDNYKAVKAYTHYDSNGNTILVFYDEMFFRGNIREAIDKIAKWSGEPILIDASFSDSMYGLYTANVSIENYSVEDFDESVVRTNLALANNQILIYRKCIRTQSDIEQFKLTKQSVKVGESKYVTERDGFVGCIRSAINYNGI